jgi:hypothetical protein
MAVPFVLLAENAGTGSGLSQVIAIAPDDAGVPQDPFEFRVIGLCRLDAISVDSMIKLPNGKRRNNNLAGLDVMVMIFSSQSDIQLRSIRTEVMKSPDSITVRPFSSAIVIM